jgi:hypothetical protein
MVATETCVCDGERGRLSVALSPLLSVSTTAAFLLLLSRRCFACRFLLSRPRRSMQPSASKAGARLLPARSARDLVQAPVNELWTSARRLDCSLDTDWHRLIRSLAGQSRWARVPGFSRILLTVLSRATTRLTRHEEPSLARRGARQRPQHLESPKASDAAARRATRTRKRPDHR